VTWSASSESSSRAVGELATSEFHTVASDRIFDRQQLFLDRDLLVFGVQFNAGFIVHGIFDNTQKSLVCTLANDDRLSDQLVAAHLARRSHGATSVAARGIQGRVYAAEIRTLRLSATTLCSHGDNIRAANHEDTLVFHQFAISNEQSTTMDVEDLALSALATVLFHVVFVPDLRAIAIGCHCVLIPANDLRDLGVKECSNVALLIDDLQDFAVNTNDATNC
jgi:hypothetical protein